MSARLPRACALAALALTAACSGGVDAPEDRVTPDGGHLSDQGPPIDGTSAFDLFAFRMWDTASGKVEVSRLDGAAGFDEVSTEPAASLWSEAESDPHGRFEVMAARHPGDAIADIYAIGRVETETSSTEIHALDGASGFLTPLLDFGTVIPPSGLDRRWTFRLADYDRDDRPDLWGLLATETGTSSIEIHVASASSNFAVYAYETGSAFPQSADVGAVPQFAVADADRDGYQDLYVITSGPLSASGATEVHILSGAAHFDTYLSRDVTALPALAVGSVSFEVGDADDDGTPDLFAFFREGTPSGSTEITILSGSGGFQTALRRGPSALGPTPVADGWSLGVAPAS